MADKGPQTWRTSAGGPSRTEKKYGWKPPEEKGTAGRQKRPAMMLALALGGMAVVGGIVYLIWLLIVPSRPGLITIAADPTEAADRLDVPYDPYGWTSARRLIEWGKAANAADTKTPLVLAEDPVFLDDAQGEDWTWIDKIRRDRKIDPLVIYIGLHGGVGPDNKPVLYTGRLDARGVPVVVRVSEIVERLKKESSLTDKRKVLVIDSARGLPDPNIGELGHDFARAVREDAQLQEAIKATPQLVVICGSDDGQRAWESADLGMTSLAFHLMKGLGGEATPQDRSAFTAADLFTFVKREVSTWAKNNRPSAQEPVMFPDPGADNRAVADYEKRRFIKSRDPGLPKPDDIAKPRPTAVPDDVKTNWERASGLAQTKPSPAAYTPLAWRRYRELLFRYELASMAEDEAGRKKLAEALDKCVRRIEEGLQLNVSGIGWTLPLPAAASKPSPDGLAAALTALAAPNRPESLRDAVNQVKPLVSARRVRPLEADLLMMTQHFYAVELKPAEEPPGDLWRRALRAKLAAEQAPVGDWPGKHSYSEQVWPLVRTDVLRLDATRRKGEDDMFAGAGGIPDYHSEARAAFDEAEKGYVTTLDAVREFQAGLRVRDELYADLPFIGRWLTEADTVSPAHIAAEHEKACALWVLAHELSALLDSLAVKGTPPTQDERQNLAAKSGKVADELKQLKNLFKQKVDDLRGSVSDQTRLQTIPPLLQVPAPLFDGDGNPLFKTEDRVLLVETVRRIEAELFRSNTPLADQPRSPSVEKVTRRATLAEKVLNEAAWKAKVEKERPSLSLHPIGDAARNPNSMAATAKATAVLAENWKALAEVANTLPEPVEGALIQRQAERLGRLGVALDAPKDPEPVTLLRRQRWRVMLEGLAARVARDHWYAEGGKAQTFALAARELLADAGAVSPGTQGPDADEAGALTLVPPLKMSAGVFGGLPVGARGDEAVRWTTEPSREMQLTLEGGGPLKGMAALWARSSERDWLTFATEGRPLVPLPAGSADGGKLPRLKVVAGDVITKSSSAEQKKVKLSAAGFFRGQPLRAADVLVTVNPRPDLVVTEARPQEGAMIALRADNDLEPGRISIVLDYSGSMAAGTDGKDDLPGGYKNPNSKLSLALKTLEDVMSALPRNTKVSIRVFAHGKAGEKWTEAGQTAWLNSRPYTKKVFPLEDERPEDYQANKATVFQRLKDLAPLYATPLVEAMEEAVRDERFLPNDKSPQTLLVLTDGANTILRGMEAPKVQDAYNVNDAGWKKTVTAAVTALKETIPSNLSVNMIFFSADKEERAALEMFDTLQRVAPGVRRPTAGRLWKSNEPAELRKQIEKVLRPKPRLFDSRDQLVDELGSWKFGMPVNRESDKPEQIWWYGPEKLKTRSTGAYNLEFAQAAEKLDLRSGDRMVIRMSGASPDINFRREVYYRDVDPVVPARRGERDGWHVAVPGYSYPRPNEHFLRVTAALEKNSPAGRGGGRIYQPRPGFVWWDLTRLPGGAEQVSEGTVFVRNVVRDQAPAPCWRIVAEDGPEPKMESVANRLRVWVSDPPDALGGRPLELPPPNQLLGNSVTRQLGPDVAVQVDLEDIRFYRDPVVDNNFLGNAARPQRCLVVRVADKTGRLLQARIPPEFDNAEIVKEHRYFFAKDGKPPAPGARPFVAGYTGIFGPFAEEAFAGADRLRIELFSVSDVIQDPGKAISLDLGVAPREQEPVKIEPGQSGVVGNN